MKNDCSSAQKGSLALEFAGSQLISDIAHVFVMFRTNTEISFMK
ncbi:hypothetical protein N824_25855 [Pedobacter sp. V48]|nr:hypothetical protein N824_25855 [Pedobacter sp. V48]